MKFIQVLVLAAALQGQAFAQQFPTIDHVVSRSQLETFGEKAAEGAADVEVKALAALALDLIKHFEAWVPGAYNDPIGLCTIGYGHLISKTTCEKTDLGRFAQPLSEADGSALLLEDSIEARLAVQDLVKVEINARQFGALSSFVFNVGRTNFRKSKLLRLLNQGEYDVAAGQLRRWSKAGGVELAGLKARRLCEETLFRGDLVYGAGGKFDRARCKSYGIAGADAGDLIDINIGE